jgi:hypothetical protein
MGYTYKSDNSNIKKNNFDVFIRKHDSDWDSNPVDISSFGIGTTKSKYKITGYDSSSDVCFCKVGNGNEKPTMKNSSGQSINLNTGDELPISENTEINFEDLNIDADNYSELRNLARSGNVDILFVDSSRVTSSALTTAQAYAAANVKLSVFLEVTGNDFNKVMIQAKKESDISENVILPISVTS